MTTPMPSHRRHGVLTTPCLLPLFIVVTLFLRIGEQRSLGNDREIGADTPAMNQADRTVISQVTTVLEAAYPSRTLDEAFGKQLVGHLLDRLDPGCAYFSTADSARFETAATSLAVDLRHGKVEVIEDIFHLYRVRAGQRAAFIDNLCKEGEKHDWAKGGGGHKPRVSATEDLDARWQERAYFYASVFRNQGTTIEAATTRTTALYRGLADRLANATSADLRDTLLSALATTFDSDAQYVGERTMAASSYHARAQPVGVGATLGPGPYGAMITHIVTTSPIGVNGCVGIGDHIIGVGDGESGEVTTVIEQSPSDVAEGIVGKSSTSVRIQILHDEESTPCEYMFRRRENDGSPVCNTFTEMQIPELGERRVSWMHLPFFTSGKAAGRGATMATSELVKTRLGEFIAEQADGLVLDLRYCQSANLREAVDIAGLFVGEGPICAVGDDLTDRQVYHSAKRRLWKRPVVVVVNQYTQCAAELVAAALQDYDAAIVVGDDATSGKGAVSLFRGFDIDEHDRLKEGKRFGILTTVGYVYRPSGESLQRHGVAADIVLPSVVRRAHDRRGRDASVMGPETRQGKVRDSVVAAIRHVIQQSNCRRSESRAVQQSMPTSAAFNSVDIGPQTNCGSPPGDKVGAMVQRGAVISSDQEVMLNGYVKEIALLTADYISIRGVAEP